MNDLANPDHFVRRHIGPRPEELGEMLKLIGHPNLDALTQTAVPGNIRLPSSPSLPQPVSEPEALSELHSIARRNKVFRSFIGLGYYDTHTPAVIQRNMFENPGWYTQYTPY